jgi:chromosome segregation ATPase
LQEAAEEIESLRQRVSELEQALRTTGDEYGQLHIKLADEKSYHETTKKRLHEVSLSWQALRGELRNIGIALDDPRTDLSMTMAEVVKDLKRKLAAVTKERDHWKANHANRVAAAKVLIDRTDLPLERVRAYEKYVEMQEMLEACQQYLKDGETPAERMARYHHDIQGLLGQLATAKEQADELREALWDIANPIAAMERDVPKWYGFNGQLAIAIPEKPDYYINKAKEALSRQDLNACPNCGGPADQGHDRCYPPTAYLCSKCQSTAEDCSAVQAKG